MQAVLETKERTQDQIFQILFDTDEVTWKQLIFNLIETEQMNPWDIDISRIAQRFLDMLKQLKQMDFRISGKIVLASAILLKMKSNKLMDEEIAALDNLINSTEIEDSLFDDFPVEGLLEPARKEKPQLVPRTPQPRKRKVSVYDLVEALEQALEQDAKRVKHAPRMITQAAAPRDVVDMSAMIQEVYDKVGTHYGNTEHTLTFDQLCPTGDREDKVYTFIPLLHLDVQRKVDLAQEEAFGPIGIHLLK